MTTVQPGGYRHYKGNEYTVLGWLCIAKPRKNSSSTARNTATTASGCDRSRCSWKR